MIYILLPCYNEYKNLIKIFPKINKIFDNYKIIMVNDCSNDQTHEKLNYLKRISRYKIDYILHQKNLGLNMALYSGFKHFLKNGKISDIIVTLDSDNTHPINLIPRMVKKIKKYNFDIVIASRFAKKSKITGLGFHRKILSEGARILFKIFLPIQNVNDYTCNFRAYKYSCIKKSKVINRKFFLYKDFSLISDLLVKLDKKNKDLLISEEPLFLSYGKKQGESKLKVFRNILLTIKVIIRNLIF